MEKHEMQNMDRSRKPVKPADIKIQIEGCTSSRTTSSSQNRGMSSDGVSLADHGAMDSLWMQENVKEAKMFKAPRRVDKMNRKLEHTHHSFQTDVADMRSMETALVRLVNDFHSGKLQAFGRHCSTEQMEAIRDQQEKLARLHFDLGAQHDMVSATPRTSGHMNELVVALEHLSQTIEQLHPDPNHSGNISEDS